MRTVTAFFFLMILWMLLLTMTSCTNAQTDTLGARVDLNNTITGAPNLAGTYMVYRPINAITFGSQDDNYIKIYWEAGIVNIEYGDSSKIKSKLHWAPTVNFYGLVDKMVEADLKLATKEAAEENYE